MNGLEVGLVWNIIDHISLMNYSSERTGKIANKLALIHFRALSGVGNIDRNIYEGACADVILAFDWNLLKSVYFFMGSHCSTPWCGIEESEWKMHAW